jgi:hypothetical protein
MPTGYDGHGGAGFVMQVQPGGSVAEIRNANSPRPDGPQCL